MSNWRDEEYERRRKAEEGKTEQAERIKKIESGASSFYQNLTLLTKKEVDEVNEDGRFSCLLRYNAKNTSSFYLWDEARDKYQKTLVEHKTYPQSIEISEYRVIGEAETLIGKTRRLLLDLCEGDSVGVRIEDKGCLHEGQLAVHIVSELVRRT